jgi:ankyrin repeat protein
MGRTALFNAANKHCTACAAMLLDAGANVNASDYV